MAMASVAVLNYQRVSGLMFHNISLTWNFQPLIFSLASPLLKKAPEMFGPLGMIPPTFALIFFCPDFMGTPPKKHSLLRFFQPHVHSGPRLSSDCHLKLLLFFVLYPSREYFMIFPSHPCFERISWCGWLSQIQTAPGPVCGTRGASMDVA